MNFWTLIRRSVTGHARSHIGALLGAMIACAALTGALIVGDSVRGSLRKIALERLGNIHYALPLGDRLVRTELAAEIGRAGNTPAAGLLQIPATATSSDNDARANQVQTLGVDETFWALSAGDRPSSSIGPDDVILNNALASQLKVKAGDSITLRVRKPTQLSQDAPLSPTEENVIALRLKVANVMPDRQLWRFSLMASQLPPLNAFVSLGELQRRLGLTNRVNLIVVSDAAGGIKALEQAVAQNWQPADAQLDIRALTNAPVTEVRSPRVFIENSAAEALEAVDTEASRSLTYLVNELRHGTNATPYSMVTGAEPPLLPSALADDEIFVNQWLADDLQVKAGDAIQLRYYVVGAMRQLNEATNSFRIKGILPMTGPTADPSLMPDFPGMSDAENCRDWDTGFAIDTAKIRPKDEKYWDEFRGTPKAFLSLAAGQKMWANRFGDLTAARFAGAERQPQAIWAELKEKLAPSAVGLQVEPVRAQALAASSQAQDFGQLFLAFSFFIILTALMLMGLLFQLGLEQRAREVGLMLSIGYEPKQVRRLLLGEGIAIAAIGAILGAALGALYAAAMLHGLRTVWSDAIGNSTILELHIRPGTLVMGALCGLLAAAFALWLTLRKQGRQPARQLLEEGAVEQTDSTSATRRRNWVGCAAVLCAAGAFAIIGSAVAADRMTPPAFFGAGALLLTGALLFCAALLARARLSASTSRLDLLRLGGRNITRRPKRSLTSIALLACGTFVIASISVFRLDSNADAAQRSAGTGGFALIGESSLPVAHNLNTQEGRDFYGIDGSAVTNAQIVQVRVRPGDDASCLNLNRAQKPRLLGINPNLLDSRGSFTFTKVAAGVERTHGWRALDQNLEDGVVPAIGDAASIQWALGKKVGDTLPYVDEGGRAFQVKLVGSIANSVLQGNLLISEANFTRLFPSESGYRMFFIDAPSNHAEGVAASLSRALADVGLEVVSAADRLAAFNAVQNTYLSTFQMLGGIGILLGSAGLAIILLRNVLERQAEFAVMQAVGFEKGQARRMAITEHSALLTLGLLAGIIPAMIAVAPSVLAPGGSFPWRTLTLTLGAAFLNGLFWTWLAARVALRRPWLDVLRNN